MVGALLLVSLGCGDATAPLPNGAVEMAVIPSQYPMWWSITEQCSGLRGDMSRISWYVVPGQKVLNEDGDDGLYYTNSHRIVLAGVDVDSGRVVRHEMLHALIGAVGHPAGYFQRACGAAVDCQSNCIRDGGAPPPVDSTGPYVSLSTLAVMTSVYPTVPLESDSSWIALTITIQNQYSSAVRVRLTPVSGSPVQASETFGFSIANCLPPNPYEAPTFDWIDGELLVLGPLEVKQRMFDIPRWSRCRVVSPFFNSRQLAPIRIQPIRAANH